MKKLLFTIVLLISLGAVADCQTQSRTSPDCVLNFNFTVTGTSIDLNNVAQLASGNSTGACSVWVVSAEAFNSGAGTITFQGAESNVAGTGPSSYSTFAGTTVSGSNPASSFPSTFVATGFNAWLRVSATVSAGTLRGSIQGWRQQTGAGGGGGGGTVISNFTTCLSGTNTLQRQAFTFTASGNTQIVAASGATTIHVCGFLAYTDAATFLKLTQGTGANCVTGTADVTSYPTGSAYSLLGLTIDFPVYANASQALCINSATAVNGGGVVVFVQN